MQYNCRLLEYPGGGHVSFYNKCFTRDGEGEGVSENFRKSYKSAARTEAEEGHCLDVSLSSTKNAIYNIARSNAWEWFVTLTFDQASVDSSDYDVTVHKLHTYLSNLKSRKCPDMKYLIVPELHADKAHYHFHGLLADCGSMRFRFSGHYDGKGRPIFNLPDWTYGFTTATHIDSVDRVAGYVTKYLTKDFGAYFANRKRYLASRNVARTESSYFLMDEGEFQAECADRITWAKNATVKPAYLSVNYYELRNDGDGPGALDAPPKTS